MNEVQDNPDTLAGLLRFHEETLLDPVTRQDRAQVSALLSEDFVEFGASGRVWTRNDILDLLVTEAYQPPVIESFECRQIAMGVALVSYKAVRTNADKGERSITLRSSIWSKEEGRWLMRFHQGTRAV